MLTHPLLPFVDYPDGLAQDFLISDRARIPMSGCCMTPHNISSERNALHAGGNALLSCMFCDQTFDHQDNLGTHILTEHPTTFSEPTVLRVEAKLKVSWEDPAPKLSSLPVEKAEGHSCIVCGHISRNTSELDSHVRKHKEYYTFCCSICGRRFREARFLKTHMKKHPKAGGKGKGPQEPEPPVTINGVVQEPASEPVASIYKMCLACGFFFPDQDTLDEHSKIHKQHVEPVDEQRLDDCAESQELYLQTLNLVPSAPKRDLPVKAVRAIPQLNPFVTYQAWQLATKGKVAVGLNHPKRTGHGVSTDESASDKDELKVILAKDEETPPKKKETGRERRPQQAQTPNKPCGSQIQKVQDRPTTCELCSKTFRTYHQLVLHSRVHKREKVVEEVPFSSVEEKQPRAASPVTIKEETLALVEEGLDHSKPKSKECSDCGKSFKSSYYLTVHLRTHTGEKPYKCAYCDYAAAQKTSLKYHIQRHHKDLPLELLVPSPTEGKQGSDEENPETKYLGPTSGSPEERSDGVCGKLVPVKTEYNELSPTNEGLLKYPSPVHMEEVDIKTEYYDEPLDLSLSMPAKAEFKSVLVPFSCSLCPYTSICPEVLIIHRRLVHKDNPDPADGYRFEGNTGLKHSTDCPPALDGKDVLPLGDGRFSHRTTSPPPPPEQPQKPLVNPPNGLMQAPALPAPSVSAPVQDGVQQSMRKRKYVMDRMVPLDRAGLSEMSYPAIGGSMWHSDAARLCLGTQFGSLPQVGHFSEPPNKRLRFLAPTDMRADSSENPGVRATPMDGPNQMLMTGMSVRSMPQGTGLPAPSEALGAGLDSDWDMMNLLRPCTPSDLAALYHSMPTNPSHGGLAPPRAGGGTMLYQHLTSLPNLQRRDPAGSFPNHRYGSSEKSA